MRQLAFAIFVLATLLIFRPLLGSVWYPTHDTTGVARTYLLEKTLASGQIPAVWSGELNTGEGYPLFHFYAPLTTYSALFLKFVAGSYFSGLKLTLMFAALFGAWGMYSLLKGEGRGGAIISALAYTFLPYAAVNLYVRGAYAEYLSMAVLPWVFYGWQNLSSLRRQLLAAAATTLFLLSHNLIPFITAPFLLVWIILRHRARLQSILLPALLTLLLSSFYLLPVVFERNFVQADQVAATTNYADHFVAPWQLWNSTWGFGGSGPGVEDGMSFKVGKVQIILALVGAIFIIFKRRKKELFFLFAALFSAFMTTAYSAFIWQSVPYQNIVQFPWRYLTLTGFFVSILAGYSFGLIKNKFVLFSAVLFSALCLLIVNLKLFAPQSLFPAVVNDYTNAQYLATIPSIVPEYAPHWTLGGNPVHPGATVLPYLYYPTWEVKINGRPVPAFPSPDGHLAVANPEASAAITVRQGHTPLENVASLISLLTLFTFVILYVKN